MAPTSLVFPLRLGDSIQWTSLKRDSPREDLVSSPVDRRVLWGRNYGTFFSGNGFSVWSNSHAPANTLIRSHQPRRAYTIGTLASCRVRGRARSLRQYNDPSIRRQDKPRIRYTSRSPSPVHPLSRPVGTSSCRCSNAPRTRIFADPAAAP